VKLRKATVADVRAIQKLVNSYARKHQIIPRSLNDLYENLRDFIVSENKGEIDGVCALHVMWEDLAEIRSLVVEKGHQGRGIGKSLVKKALKEARSLGVKRVFALTYMPEYFVCLGFMETEKSKLPQKIWADCLRCTKFPDCDETAVIKTLD
jgi:amino-acid N-acetyltransferase